MEQTLEHVVSLVVKDQWNEILVDPCSTTLCERLEIESGAPYMSLAKGGDNGTADPEKGI